MSDWIPDESFVQAALRKAMRVADAGLLDPDDFRDGVLISDDNPHPGPGAVEGACSHCGAHLVMSPHAAELLRRKPELRLIDSPCALAIRLVERRRGQAEPLDYRDVEQALRDEQDGNL